MPKLIKSIILDNGLLIRFYDQTNRYFGDFHRVCIRVTIEISLSCTNLPTDLQSMVDPQATDVLGLEKNLERMGVQGNELEKVRNTLIDDYLAAALPYIAKQDYPLFLLRKKLQGKTRLFQLPRNEN